jgi:hypothetical protein
MDFEQAKKVLQLTDARIRKFGSVDASTSREIHEAIFKFQPFQRLVIAHHAQEALTHLREQTVPLANSLEQLIATAINLTRRFRPARGLLMEHKPSLADPANSAASKVVIRSSVGSLEKRASSFALKAGLMS